MAVSQNVGVENGKDAANGSSHPGEKTNDANQHPYKSAVRHRNAGKLDGTWRIVVEC